MGEDIEIDWGQTARIERLERRAWKEQGIVLIRLDRVSNKILKRLIEDHAVSRLGPREEARR
jgi:hypothetical protein